MKTTAFRNAVGTSIVRGTLIQSVDILRDGAQATTVSIAGAGRGHGVGLCQWGARGLAADGASAQAIVQFYFPGTALGRA
jgi:stage II sporulation protein D